MPWCSLSVLRLAISGRNLNPSTLETVPGRLISVDCFFSLTPCGNLGVPPRNRPVTLALIVRLRDRLTVTLPFRLAVILGLPRPNLALVLPFRLVTGAGHPCPNLAVRLTLISPSWPRARARTGH